MCQMCSGLSLDFLCKNCRVFLFSKELLFSQDEKVYSLFPYILKLKDIIQKMKNGEEERLINYFTKILCIKSEKMILGERFDGVIPVPPKKPGDKDHAYKIANYFSEYFNLELLENIVGRNSFDETSQKDKTEEERKNIRFSKCDQLIDQGRYILIDDVITTGSTLKTIGSLWPENSFVGFTLASTPRWLK